MSIRLTFKCDYLTMFFIIYLNIKGQYTKLRQKQKNEPKLSYYCWEIGAKGNQPKKNIYLQDKNDNKYKMKYETPK